MKSLEQLKAELLEKLERRWESCGPQIAQEAGEAREAAVRRACDDVPAADPELCPVGLLDCIQEAAERKHWPIYIQGPTGIGKTCTAAVVFRRAIEKALARADQSGESLVWPRWTRWESFFDTLHAIRRTGSWPVVTEDGRTFDCRESSWWDRFSGHRLVVLDEIGLQRQGPERVEAMLEFLERRRRRPLLITGNLSRPEVEARYDQRVASRLWAGSVIEVSGQDRRVAGASERARTAGRLF